MISYPSSRHVSSSARHVSSYHILPTCHTSILTWRSSYQRSSSYRSSYQSHINIDDDRHITSTSMIWRSWHVHLWVMSHISTSHVPHINVDMIWRSSHISTSHGTCIYESCHTYQRVMSHVSTIDDMTLIWRVVMIPRSYHNNDSITTIVDRLSSAISTIIGHCSGIDYHRPYRLSSVDSRYGDRHVKTGLFCKRALQKRQYSAKETYNFKAPTHRGHPIWGGFD